MSQCYRSLSDLAGPVFGTWKKLRVYFYTRLKMYFLMISLAATSNASAMPKQNAPRPLNADFKPMNSTALRKRWVRNDNRNGDCVLLPRTWPKEWEHVLVMVLTKLQSLELTSWSISQFDWLVYEPSHLPTSIWQVLISSPALRTTEAVFHLHYISYLPNIKWRDKHTQET